MAFGGQQFQIDLFFATKVIEYFAEVSKIEDAEKKLQYVNDHEAGLLWNFLEGSSYEDENKALKDIVRIKGFGPHAEANARVKLQQRAAKDAGIFGKQGLNVVAKKKTKEETDKVIELVDSEDDNADSLEI